MSSKKNKTQKKINKKKVFIALTICILVALIGGVSVLAYGVYKDTETFDAKKLLSSGASVMYDDQGQVLYTYGSEENGTRENITYEDLPQFLSMLLSLLKIHVFLNIMVLICHVLLKQLCLI